MSKKTTRNNGLMHVLNEKNKIYLMTQN